MTQPETMILDGGMGRELERMGAPFSQPFWSAQALIDAPEIVAQAHRNFINAGAQIITTNCYAIVPPHIGETLFHARGRALIGISAKIAREEADKAPHPMQVAACIPPVFGSYQPDLFNPKTAVDLIAPFFEEQEPYADLFLAETISSLEEALMIQKVYQDLKMTKPLWLSFTLQEFYGEAPQPQLRSGENICDTMKKIVDQNLAQAILFNCCSVEDISASFDLCEYITTIPSSIRTGAYANVFGQVKEKRRPTEDLSILRKDITPEVYLDYAKEWQKKGATIIGGCCGIGPEYIELLAKKLKR